MRQRRHFNAAMAVISGIALGTGAAGGLINGFSVVRIALTAVGAVALAAWLLSASMQRRTGDDGGAVAAVQDDGGSPQRLLGDVAALM